MHEENGRIRWAASVPRELVRRLYESEASGMLDNELLEDVLFRTSERVRDVLLVTEAMAGRATCPRCDAVIEHDGRDRTMLRCTCGFTTRWRDYRKSFYNRALHGPRDPKFFETFNRELPRARTHREKFLAFDRFIHEHHDFLRAKIPTHFPAAANVIEGPAVEVLKLLDSLAYGDRADPRLLDSRDVWRERVPRGRRPDGAWYFPER